MSHALYATFFLPVLQFFSTYYFFVQTRLLVASGSLSFFSLCFAFFILVCFFEFGTCPRQHSKCSIICLYSCISWYVLLSGDATLFALLLAVFSLFYFFSSGMSTNTLNLHISQPSVIHFWRVWTARCQTQLLSCVLYLCVVLHLLVCWILAIVAMGRCVYVSEEGVCAVCVAQEATHVLYERKTAVSNAIFPLFVGWFRFCCCFALCLDFARLRCNNKIRSCSSPNSKALQYLFSFHCPSCVGSTQKHSKMKKLLQKVGSNVLLPFVLCQFESLM